MDDEHRTSDCMFCGIETSHNRGLCDECVEAGALTCRACNSPFVGQEPDDWIHRLCELCTAQAQIEYLEDSAECPF